MSAAAYAADTLDIDSPATARTRAHRSGSSVVVRPPTAPPEVEPATALLNSINDERAGRGLASLRSNPRLVSASQGHANYLAQLGGGLPHVGPNGQTLADRVDATGYRWGALGETLAAGITQPSSVVRAWIASPSHEQVIMSALFTEVGIAATFGQNGQIYWTLVAATSP